MVLTCADTHNIIAYLTKSDASEGFNQIIDFLNASSIKYALTVNPNIYVSCIKQFWSSVSVKKVNDVMRLQALIDRKKVIITKATIREALQLDEAESIDCLPNEEIFTELPRTRYEKPSTKLTFYKAFFSPQWKFLIYTILQCMSTKRTSWNEFSSSMATAVICLSTETHLFKGMIVAQQTNDVADEVAVGVDVDDVHAAVEPTLPSPTPTIQPPPPSQELPSTLHVIPTPPPSLIPKPSSPLQQQQPSQPTHDAAISLDLKHTLLETCTTLTRKVEALEQDKVAQALEIIKLKQKVKMLERKNKLKVSGLRRLRKGEIIANIDADEDVTLKDVAAIEKTAEIEENADVQGRLEESQAQIYKIDLEHADKVLSMQDDELEPSELKEVVEVVTTAKLMTEVVTAAAATITVVTTPITTATITIAPSAIRRRKGVVIRDSEKTATPSIIIHSEPKLKDKDQVQRKEKEDNVVMRYQTLKRKLQTEAQARKNMMIYLRNMVGFKMDYFKGMSYDNIRPIFEKYFNSNVAFLEKTKEHLEEEENIALKRKTKSSEEKAAKKQKLDEEVEELKKHLHIVPNNDDDVYTEATPLALKVPVTDYEIYTENNKSYFKIIIADGTHQLFLRFLSLLRNFDIEDLEVLWQIGKERFASSKPKNFLDDFLLTTLTYMFEKPDVDSQVWKSQRGVFGLAKVKSWRLLKSCGVHVIPLQPLR
nr:xylulose kinase-1 [Tanacetum cinerariifolium]